MPDMTATRRGDVGHAERLAPHARHRDLVVIAGSAGSVLALLEIVGDLPSDFSTPVAVVLHRTSTPPHMLEGLLAKRTAMRVIEVKTGAELAPRTIFVAPPGQQLTIRTDRTFAVQEGTRIDHLYSSANPLFESAAQVLGTGVVGVVLSGTGRNGARGVVAIKGHGGTVLVQDEATAAFFEMPGAAIQTGAVDFVLPADEIANALDLLCTRAPTPAREHMI